MKLAEALALRADVQKRVSQMRTRLTQNALVQEGDNPSEDPHKLLAELDRLLNQLEQLMKCINRTNLQVRLPDGRTLTDALAQRDVLFMRYSTINAFIEAAAKRLERYSNSEIRVLTTVKVSDLRMQLDEVARQHRELDTAIQATNWLSELIEE